MGRQLRALDDIEALSTSAEARAAALQYIRVVSGAARPTPELREVFERTVLEVAVATQRLLDQLEAHETHRPTAAPHADGGHAAVG